MVSHVCLQSIFRSSDTFKSLSTGLTVNIHVSTKTCVTGNNVILHKALQQEKGEERRGRKKATETEAITSPDNGDGKRRRTCYTYLKRSMTAWKNVRKLLCLLMEAAASRAMLPKTCGKKPHSQFTATVTTIILP